MIVDNDMKPVRSNTVNAPSKVLHLITNLVSLTPTFTSQRKIDGPVPKANSKRVKSTAIVAKTHLDNDEPVEPTPFAHASNASSSNLIILDDDDAIMAGPLDSVNAPIDPVSILFILPTTFI